MSTQCQDTVGWTTFDAREVGYKELARSLQLVQQQQEAVGSRRSGSCRCLVVDSDDLLAAPEQMLTAICSQVSVPFEYRMVAWETPPEVAAERFKLWGPWHESAIHSTGFDVKHTSATVTVTSNATATTATPTTQAKQTTPDSDSSRRVISAAVATVDPLYREMYSQRLSLS